MLRDDFAVLRRSDADLDLEDRAVIELVFDAPRSASQVAEAIGQSLPEAQVAVRTAFERDEDRFHFVEFPKISPRGQESLLFARARSLRPEVGAVEAHPVLPDALYGAAALGATDRESFMALCETDRRDDRPFGWVHQVIKTPGAWAMTRGAGSTVAVIDTGHSTHRELQGAIRTAGQRNFVEGGSDASDRFASGWFQHPGHGTLVCSVVASRGGVTATGGTTSPGAVTGSAPEATLLPIRAIKSVINYSQSTIPAAIAHAVAQGADVITCHVDSPKVVVETAAGRGAFVCGYHANQSPLAPEKYLTGAEWAWGNVYTDFINKAQAGEPMGNFVRGGLKDGFVKMSPLGPAVSDEARNKFEATKAEMMKGGYSVFKTGLKDNNGNVVVTSDLVEDAIELESMGYLVEGVIGSTS